MCQETLHESSLHASAVRTYIALNRCDFTPEQPDMSQETPHESSLQVRFTHTLP
jgi:hypothetical protein